MDGDSTFNFSGNIYANSIYFSGSTKTPTLVIASGKSLYGALTQNAANGTGTVTFSGTTTVGYAIGGAGSSLAAVNFNGAGTASFNSDIYATTTTVASGATLAVGTTNKTVTGTLVNNGTLDFSSLKLNHAGTLTLSTGSTLKTTITSSANGWLSGNQNNVTPAGTLTVTPTLSGVSIASGDKFILIRGAGTANVTPANVTTPTGGLISWSVDDGTSFSGSDKYGTAIAATDVVLRASVQAAASVSGVSSAATKSVDALTSYTGTNAQLQTLQQAVQSLSSGSEIDKAGTQLRPMISGGNVQGSMNAINQVLKVLGLRIESVRLADAGGGGTGVATGEAMKGLDVWMQGFGGVASQFEREGIDGYASDTWGMAGGVDFRVIDPLRLGLSFSYARTNVNENGLRRGSGLDIDSYTGSVYGHWEGSPWYLDGSLGYTRHDYGSTRMVNFTGFSGVASGKYSGDQYTARLGGGYPLQMGGAVLTPLADLAFSHLKTQGYTETGAAGANLQVNGQSVNSLRSGLGAKVAYRIDASEGRFIPEVRAIWRHEYLDTDASTTTAAYAAGGSSFTTTGAKPTSNAANVGVGLTFLSSGDMQLSGHYDAELKSDYISHTGKAEVKYSF
jgi:outer membrane autotransporter protein